MELDISWEETSVNQLEQPGLKEILRRGIHEALLSGGGREEAEIGLVLVDDKTIGELNKSYRGIDGPTDVLSFAIQEKGEGEPDIIMQDLLEDHQLGYPDSILGDIVVSVERARAQAEEYGHSFEREIVYLAVHGTLHLLGFNHCSDQETMIMRSKEEQVMKKLDLLR